MGCSNGARGAYALDAVSGVAACAAGRRSAFFLVRTRHIAAAFSTTAVFEYIRVWCVKWSFVHRRVVPYLVRSVPAARAARAETSGGTQWARVERATPPCLGRQS